MIKTDGLLIVFGGIKELIGEKNDIQVFNIASKKWVQILRENTLDKTVYYRQDNDQSPERETNRILPTNRLSPSKEMPNPL